MFCEHFQQYWPCRVPVKCCVRLSFILIVMTHPSCNHFKNRFSKGSSIRRTGNNNFPPPLGRKNGSLCEEGRLAGRNAESLRTSFLVAGLTWNMGHTNLLDASLRLCRAGFSSFGFLGFGEQFCTSCEFGIGNMNFIHEPTLSSGNHNIGCPFRIIRMMELQFQVHIGQ